MTSRTFFTMLIFVGFVVAVMWFAVLPALTTYRPTLPCSAKGQKRNAGDDRERTGDPQPGPAPFAQPPDPPGGDQHDGGLAKRRNDGQRRHAQGEQDHEVGGGHRHADRHGEPRFVGQARSGDAADGRIRDQEDRPEQPEKPAVNPRGAQPDTDPIQGRIGGDHHPRQQGWPQRRARVGGPADRPDPSEQRHNAKAGGGVEVFAKQEQADQQGEQQGGAPGDRVDDRELPTLVGRREADEVDQLQERRGEREEPTGKREPGPAGHDPGDGDRRQRHDGSPAHGPRRQRERVLRCLEQRVPGGVKGGRHQHQGQNRQRHERSLASRSTGHRAVLKSMLILLMSAMARKAASRAGTTSARAPRAIWNGTIAFGMVIIPVRLYTATQPQDVRFHLLHKRDGVRLKNIRWCPKDEKAVPWEEVVRGFEYTKGRYVPISDEDLDHLPVKNVHTVDISDFVKLDEVDPIYYDKAYYLAPEETGAKAFVLLRQALEQTGRAAVAKVAIRDKESLCLVRPYQGVLSMETLFYANEIRSTQDSAVDELKVSPKELQMAVSLIENLSDTFEAERYEDEYQAALKQVIEAKVAGAPLPEAPTEEGAKVVDLMEALRASIEATKNKRARPEGKPASASRNGSRRRRKSA